ncbi:major facilitator superfamily domain-containing protein [Coniella lustricola]|uniref:Major facilitator superfamily domain-containing protein n=1 Tax=Coniella lustricola TaxID=2025994 RepID=A0A2T3AFG5_9PEZI|nr:major facilitator superfamily domain-containing protein [Coniella lustricola]
MGRLRSSPHSAGATIEAAEPLAPNAPSQQPPLPVSDPGPIPDGGLQAWLQVLGSWVVLAATWGLVNSFGVYQTYYETVLLSSASSSSISWIGSIQAFLLMFAGVVAGPLYDAGHFRLLLICGLFLIIFGMFMTSLAWAYWQIVLAQGLCVGIGMAFCFLPSTAILAQYFSTRRALAIGISSSGSPIGGIIFPIVLSSLTKSLSFGWATRVIAFMLLGLSVIPLVFMRTRVPPTGRKRALIDTAALRDPAFVLFVAASFFLFLCLYTAFFYLQLFDEKHEISSLEFSPYIVTLLNTGSVFGRLLPNYLADKVGSVNICLACGLMSAVLLYGWLGIHNLGGLVVFALLYGLSSGGIVSVTPSAVMTLTPDISLVGTRLGMLFMLCGVSILLGTPIAGWILGRGFTIMQSFGQKTSKGALAAQTSSR